MFVHILLRINVTEKEYDYKGEESTFDVKIQSPELIDAIDLNSIKKTLVQQAVEKKRQADIIAALEDK